MCVTFLGDILAGSDLKRKSLSLPATWRGGWQGEWWSTVKEERWETAKKGKIQSQVGGVIRDNSRWGSEASGPSLLSSEATTWVVLCLLSFIGVPPKISPAPSGHGKLFLLEHSLEV